MQVAHADTGIPLHEATLVPEAAQVAGAARKLLHAVLNAAQRGGVVVARCVVPVAHNGWRRRAWGAEVLGRVLRALAVGDGKSAAFLGGGLGRRRGAVEPGGAEAGASRRLKTVSSTVLPRRTRAANALGAPVTRPAQRDAAVLGAVDEGGRVEAGAGMG